MRFLQTTVSNVRPPALVTRKALGPQEAGSLRYVRTQSFEDVFLASTDISESS